jgi:uncharacterized protein YciI
MKKLFVLAALVLTSFTSFSQADKKETKPEDQVRKYWFVMLKRGSVKIADSAESSKIQAGHLANIVKLYNEGIIKVSGPFAEKGEWKGLFIMDIESREEAEKLLQADPAIAAGALTYEIKPWLTAPIGSFVPGKPKQKY